MRLLPASCMRLALCCIVDVRVGGVLGGCGGGRDAVWMALAGVRRGGFDPSGLVVWDLRGPLREGVEGFRGLRRRIRRGIWVALDMEGVHWAFVARGLSWWSRGPQTALWM